MKQNKIGNAPVYGLLALVSALSALLVIVNACGGGSSSSPDSGVTGKDGGSHGCKAPETLCQGSCVNYKTDPDHCGGCNDHLCANGGFCVNGKCQADCPAEMRCARLCIDKMSDNYNCGQCGMMCAGDTRCNSGMCTCPVAGQTPCSGGLCVDLSSDNSNCGTCGKVCSGDLSCISGDCNCQDSNTSRCPGDKCVDLMHDPNNCHTCGNKCDYGFVCNGTSCEKFCTDPTKPDFCPGPLCTDLSKDSNHCGSCTNQCTGTEDCVFGVPSACRPKNDRKSGAYDITPTTLGENFLSGPYFTTVHATASASQVDPAPASCIPASDINVWYKFTLGQQELVYADTINKGNTLNTKLYFAYASSVANIDGTPITGGDGIACSHDACGLSGGQIAMRLTAGTYYIVVSSDVGVDFTLHFQHLRYKPGTDYSFTNDRISGMGQTNATTLGGTVAKPPTCAGTQIGEDAYWFVSCGNQDSLFSLCKNGGYWKYITYNSSGGILYHNPVLDIFSGSTGGDSVSWCNDDTAGCLPMGQSGQAYGSEIKLTLPLGLNIVTIGDRNNNTGLPYVIGYDIH